LSRHSSLITESLTNAGLDVITAIDAAQALRTALARKAAAVVLDIGLPDHDGTQFVARWRERRPDANDVPILIVSGRSGSTSSSARWSALS
jgi:DNA-binding response OmpR family regulator